MRFVRDDSLNFPTPSLDFRRGFAVAGIPVKYGTRYHLPRFDRETIARIEKYAVYVRKVFRNCFDGSLRSWDVLGHPLRAW